MAVDPGEGALDLGEDAEIAGDLHRVGEQAVIGGPVLGRSIRRGGQDRLSYGDEEIRRVVQSVVGGLPRRRR